MAAVAHAHRLRVGGQGQFVAGACIAEDVATVSAVVLEDRKAAIMGHQSPLGCTPVPYFQPLPRGSLEGVLNLHFHVYVPDKSMEHWEGVHLQELTLLDLT